MTTPTHGSDESRRDDEVNLSKNPSGETDAPFDPYRFGKPEHPIPPEYAPPGYEPPAHSSPPGSYPSAAYGQQPSQGQNQYGQGQYGQNQYGQNQYGQQGYGHQQYGQNQYGQQPYGAYPGTYGQTRQGNGKATAGLVLGILSLVLCWLSFFDLLLIVPALVFGILGINDAKNRNGAGRGLAIAGVACAVVGAVLATVLTVYVFKAADKCGGFENSDDPGFSNCISDNFLD